MSNHFSKGELSDFTRKTLARLVNECLEIIQEQKLLKRYTGEKYTQARVATFIGRKRAEDLSNAKNDKEEIGERKMAEIVFSLLTKFPELILNDQKQVVLRNSSQEFVRELAGKLALNLIDISTEFDEEGIPYEEILVKKETFAAREAEENVKRERFIAVIGAGASNAFTSKSKSAVPNAQEAIAKLQKAFEEKLRDTDMLAEKTKRVADRMRTSPDNFEAQLLAMAQFSTSLVTKELTRLCGNKNVPCLGYEVMAHMFKHRFIDVIVNFNYDELLDNAISEELPNPGDYRYIYTAGHCPNKLGDLRIANRIKQPIYVKCHGTISQPNSLRFTETKDFMMEEAIQDHLLELFKGKVPDAISQEYLPVNLLVFGFSMRNHVFNEIIRRSLETNPEKLTIWLFDLNPNLNHFVHTQFAQLIESGKIEVKFILLEKEAQLEEILIDLWRDITNNFDDYYKPRGIDRHLFVDHVFRKVSPISLYRNQEKGEGRVLEKYYQDRLFVELFILILQSNGTIHLSQLTRSRAGKCLIKLKNEKKDRQPIFYYLKKMGMIPYENFMFDTFVVKNRKSLTTKETLIEFLIEKLKGNLLMRESRRAINGINALAPLVLGILKRRLLLVNPQYDHVHDNIFSRLPPKNVLNTSLAWIYNYRQNIVSNSDRWNVMLSVSEEGGFLRKDFLEKRFEGSGKFFELILAATGINEHSSGASDWMDQSKLLSGALKYRPWWLHNKHMVILLKRKPNSYTGQWDKDWKLVEGFFYHHKMLSRRVNPVKIDDPEDLKTLLYMFAIYWRGTIDTPVLSEYEELDLRVITNLDDIEGTITDILKPYEEKRHQKE